MGLKGGPDGAKAVFKEKFAAAFQDFRTLRQVRECVGVGRVQTLVVVDGNVLVMQIPQSVTTFRGYVEVMTTMLHSAIQAGEHVVVVFDEPENLTRAKQEEQAKRDARRAPQTPRCSEDVARPCPTDDAYDQKELEASTTNVCLMVKNHRKTRPRLYDSLFVAVLKHFRDMFANQDGAWSITFDGVDKRGMDRPVDAPRVLGLLSSHPEIWEPVLTRETPIGEGDLKLTDVCNRVYRARETHPESRLAEVRLNMLSTIDTDSFMIELIAQSRREKREDISNNELTLLCLREAPRKRKDPSESTPAHYTCVDMEAFHNNVMTYMFGSQHLKPEIEARKPLAALLLSACIALCGCDFVELQGLRADLVLPCVRDVARNQPELLALMAGVQTGEVGATRNAAGAIKAVVDEFVTSISGAPRMQKRTVHASACSDLQILRALWTTAYWSEREFKDCHQWGFNHAAMD
jgi:hypothetical protein